MKKIIFIIITIILSAIAFSSTTLAMKYKQFPSPCGKLPTPIACLLQKVLPRSLFHPQFLKLDFKFG